jgi:hypothetical protein
MWGFVVIFRRRKRKICGHSVLDSCGFANPHSGRRVGRPSRQAGPSYNFAYIWKVLLLSKLICCDVTPCCLNDCYRRFGRICYLLIQCTFCNWTGNSSFSKSRRLWLFGAKIKVKVLPETSVIIRNTKRKQDSKSSPAPTPWNSHT